jgi:creatinine amidohydrolase
MLRMNPIPRYWAEMTSADFDRLDPARAVAVLPLGATEQHGPHLPLSVDTVLVDGVVRQALGQVAASAQVLVLPTQTIGLSTEHTAFAGTLSLSPQTLIRLWVEIGESVARAGLRKLVLFNAHGGHVGAMDIVARELRGRCGLIVYHTSWAQLPLGDAVTSLFSPHEWRFGVHGGDLETSMMLALQPGAVRCELAQDFRSTAQDRAAHYPVLGDGRSAKLGWHMQDYNPQGAAGNATAATQDKGQALLQAAGEQLARLLHEVALLPLDTLRTL